MTFEIADLYLRLKTWADLSQNCNLHDFYEIWYSEQIEYAKYDYNTRQCLEHSCDYWLKMIIGWEWL